MRFIDLGELWLRSAIVVLIVVFLGHYWQTLTITLDPSIIYHGSFLAKEKSTVTPYIFFGSLSHTESRFDLKPGLSVLEGRRCAYLICLELRCVP